MDNAASDAPALQHFEDVDAADLEQFLLYGKAEIRQTLRAIVEHRERVTLYFGSNNEFILTSLLAVDADSVILDCGREEEVNRRLLVNTSLVFATTREQIKVQWNSTRIWRVTHDGKPAFCIALPDSLLRLQRRESYRLAAPMANPLRCIVQVRGARARKFDFSVANISLGGVALYGPLKEAEFEIGRSYRDCEIALPEIGTLVATIVVANLYELTRRNGTATTRSGCRFVDLSGKMLLLLQRYINRVERERHQRMARLETGD